MLAANNIHLDGICTTARHQISKHALSIRAISIRSKNQIRDGNIKDH